MRAKLAGLVTVPPLGKWHMFSPVTDTFLKEQLFADLFVRGVISHRDGELKTIAALANMAGTEGQLRFHLAAAMNTWLTQAQMKKFKCEINMSGLLLSLMILQIGYMGNNTIKPDGSTDMILDKERKVNSIYTHISVDDYVHHIVKHPAFKAFGQYLLPWDNSTNYYNTSLNNVGSLLPYHDHVDPNLVVGAINHMIDEVNDGKTIFYDFYTEREKQEDPTKASAGLFFFRGNPGAPFAIVCPGGGFAYVGSLHEGYPHTIELSKKGYNVFVLKYRVGSQLSATEDLAAAISYIFKKAETFEVSTENYSLWGSSAGARMVGTIALNGTASFGGYDLPKSRIVVIAYTGHTNFSENYPPVFITVSEDDRIVNVSVVDRRFENLRNAGIEVEYRKYKNAGHGFGLGVGTDAEGWIEYAIQFWENY